MSVPDVSSAGDEQTGPEPSLEWVREFVGPWFDAWNSHRADRVLEFLTEDVELRDDSWPRTMRGHADVREFREALWRGLPDLTFQLLDGPYVIPGEPRASLHWRGAGTFTGVMDPPGFAPTGRRWESDGADFQEYRDGRICKLRVTFDMLGVGRQLGLMPASGSLGERAMAAAQRALMRLREGYRRRASRG